MRDDEAQPEERRRKIGRGTLAAIAIIAVVLVCGIGYLAGSRAVPQNNLYAADRAAAAPGLSADNGAIPTYAGPPAVDRPVAPAPAPAPDVTGPPPARVPADAMADSVARDDATDDDDNGATESDADRQGHAEIDEAINDATLAALDQGGSVRWHKDGLSGSAVAGAAITDGVRTCRNVYATTVRDDSETRSPIARWCRTGEDGEWARR